MARLNRRLVLQMGVATITAAAIPEGARARQQRVILNDASKLNPTPITRHWIVGPDDEASLIANLRLELKRAATTKEPIAIGAARHSMGGQSLPRDGTAITLAINRCELNTAAKTYEAHAGTRWSQIITKLDPLGFSPAVMQSNNDFGIASTFSVNSHGWPVPYGPFGSTVRRIEMMLADGTIANCSRTENTELFNLAMGGYGNFGIILKVEADRVDNVMVKPTFKLMPTSDFPKAFVGAANNKNVLMLYGRLSVARDDFFKEALLISYAKAPSAQPLVPASAGGFVSSASREIYRAQVGSDKAKRARWFAETVVAPKTSTGVASRNSLMNEPAANLASRDRTRTDILHEYFIPPERFGDFVAACQAIIPKSGQELLNITLRYVGADEASVLAYAPAPRIAGVMSFAQLVTPEAEASMLRMTESLIERVGDIGGSFYLPYRLHARPDQVAKIYPRAAEFAARKKHFDPDLVFRNAMWPAYFAGLA